MKTIHAVVLGMALTGAACAQGSTKTVGGTAQVPAQRLAMNAVVVIADGPVEGRVGADASYVPLEKGRPIAQLAAVRTGDGGCMIDLGEQRGRLWVKPGSAIELGQDAAGLVSVLVAKGEARLKDGSRDVLFFPHDAKTEDAETARHLELADWSLALGSKKEAAGIGSLEAQDGSLPPGGGGGAASGKPGDNPRPVQPAQAFRKLELKSVHVKATLVGDQVETEVEHVFHNDGDRQLEGTFRFPLPEGAQLVGLAMQIDERLMEGELVERDKARKVYDEIVDSMQDPALLEWEHGNTFKLRVFPIEPNKDKRVVLRYTAPLHRALNGWEFVYPTAAPDMQTKIGSFEVDFGGKVALSEKGFVPGHDVVVPVTTAIGQALRETRADGIYTAVRIRPDWSKMAAPKKERAPRRVIVVVDTSRSALEERNVEIDTVKMVLGELGPKDRFVTVAADVDVRAAANDLADATPQAIEAQMKFIDALEFDGASDFGAALKRAGEIAKKAGATKDGDVGDVEVVYIGDGTATWGETDGAALEKIAKEALGDVPLHAAVLGKNADTELVRGIAATLGGQVVRPRTAIDAKRFALMLNHASELRRLTHVKIAGDDKDVVFPGRETTLFEGEEIVALVKTPSGQAPPTSLTLNAKSGGADYKETVPVGAIAGSTSHTGQRWAKEQIAFLEKQDGKKDDVVKLSLDFGIMSQYTSFLVLESEEQYAKYDIARRQAAQQAKNDRDPSVTGADLESIGGRNAHLSPDHLQPGDPEIQIPAPADAQSVVVVLPFGETKIASFEAGLNAWTTRFLIDKDTPDGTYQVVVKITHKDGSLEVLKLDYVVDTKKPNVDVTVRQAPHRPGTLEIHALQVISQAEITSAIPHPKGTLDEQRKRYAQILTDSQRVEVRTPDGEVITLTALRLGDFRGFWTPQGGLPAGNVTLHVVAVDRAMNQNVFDVSLPVK